MSRDMCSASELQSPSIGDVDNEDNDNDNDVACNLIYTPHMSLVRSSLSATH